jgi:copper homeostasis protein
LTLVEAAVESLEGALAAERAGSDRIELCVNLDVGGTTPGAELIAAVTRKARVPVFVLIRPRAGSFVYTRREVDKMVRDVELVGTIGAAGIVTGAISAEGAVDFEQTRTLVEAAAGLPVTFHRAFDSTANLPAALERVIEAGATRVLTSGGAPAALEGADALASLVNKAGERISIVAGGSVRDHNVRELITRTGVREVHARLVDEAGMQRLIDVVRMLKKAVLAKP